VKSILSFFFFYPIHLPCLNFTFVLFLNVNMYISFTVIKIFNIKKKKNIIHTDAIHHNNRNGHKSQKINKKWYILNVVLYSKKLLFGSNKTTKHCCYNS